MGDLVALPNIHVRFWRKVAGGVRASLELKGVSGEACDWVVNDMMRRLESLPTNFMPPPGLDNEHAIAWLNEAVGTIVSEMIGLELELYQATWPSQSASK
jgi:hypothetical protein